MAAAVVTTAVTAAVPAVVAALVVVVAAVAAAPVVATVVAAVEAVFAAVSLVAFSSSMTTIGGKATGSLIDGAEVDDNSGDAVSVVVECWWGCCWKSCSVSSSRSEKKVDLSAAGNLLNCKIGGVSSRKRS